ncbi:M15 family metallopeptidase [Timonella sp. A28]|uniref:M15 family metallopeptidase n=1 Tax=Timonella sp. A28 TaxID=3442640 RepID=UPI003EBD8A1D
MSARRTWPSILIASLIAVLGTVPNASAHTRQPIHAEATTYTANSEDPNDSPQAQGPNPHDDTSPSRRNSPKVGQADAPPKEAVETYQKLISKTAAAADEKLNRPEVVALTAWLLGDWSTFDGDYGNGQLPDQYLMDLLTAPGHKLRHDAAIMFDMMSVDFSSTFGRSLKLTDSYRTLETQYVLKAQKPFLAARPGTSNHGWGLAVDIAGPEASFGTEERQWLVDNGWKYGWFSPTWAHPDGVKPESWHFEYMGTSAAAWPHDETTLDRLDELSGDPTQGIFNEKHEKKTDESEPAEEIDA